MKNETDKHKKWDKKQMKRWYTKHMKNELDRKRDEIEKVDF